MSPRHLNTIIYKINLLMKFVKHSLYATKQQKAVIITFESDINQ